jgi:hypothetical protein
MTDTTHEPTEQETAIYDALHAGDHDTIDRLRVEAYEADELEQFDVDYLNAHAHYQADHETAERDRVEQTTERVEDENTEAPDG